MGNSETALRTEELIVDRSKGEVHDDWNILPGKLGNTDVTIFSAVLPSSSKKTPYINKALQASKVYRHPGILRYFDGGILGNEIIVITEEAVPILKHGLKDMSFLEITAGIVSIAEALMFLHDKAGVSHNNVCPSSIYITKEGNWKLWGFEYSCCFGDLTRDHIEKINQYCYDKSIPPDEKSRISPSYQHARDVFFLGKFVENTIAPVLQMDEPLVKEFLSFIQTNALHPDYSERSRISVFLQHPVFQHQFLKLRKDLNNVLLMPASQRDDLIKSLPTVLKSYSDSVVASTLAPVLLSHSFLLIPSSASHLMPCLLTPKSDAESPDDKGLFSVPVFKKMIVPLILQLFVIHDASIRKILLTHFKSYATLFGQDQLREIILPQLLLGIKDTDEELVAISLQCLSCLVPLLGADVVVGKNREHIFATAKPKNKLSGITTEASRRRVKKARDRQRGPDKLQDTVSVEDQSVSSELAKLNLENLEYFIDIPERSSPDGGETLDDELVTRNQELDERVIESPSEEQWSDWEDMLDQPTPEIRGVLQVKTPEAESDYVFKDYSSTQSSQNNFICSNDATIKLPKDVSQQNVTLHQKSPQNKKISHSQGLGEEYDIMSLKIEKKPDSERDLFADLTPNLITKKYNLESLLIEASHQTREKFPSLSDTLAELDNSVTQEGDDWNDDVTFMLDESFNANNSCGEVADNPEGKSSCKNEGRSS